MPDSRRRNCAALCVLPSLRTAALLLVVVASCLAAQPAAARQSLVESLRLAHGSDWAALEPGLRRALAEADKLGWCHSAGEFHREINSVAVPLVGPGGETYALNCGTAAFVFTEDHLRQVVAPRLVMMARALAAEVGGSVPGG